MVVGLSKIAIAFISILFLQVHVASADPGPSLGIPSHVQIQYDPQTHTVALTWEPPSDAAPGTPFTYQVSRDNVQVYAGNDLSFQDAAPGAVATVYSITAVNGDSLGLSAYAVYDPVEPANFPPAYPYCLDIVHAQPTPTIKWECILPVP